MVMHPNGAIGVPHHTYCTNVGRHWCHLNFVMAMWIAIYSQRYQWRPMVPLSPLAPMVIHWRQWWYSNGNNGTIGANGGNSDNGEW
jgi:hypothetical protein